MTCGYIRKPGALRLCNPMRGIYRRARRYVVKPWVPGEGLIHVGTCGNLREAQQMRDAFLRQKGLK